MTTALVGYSGYVGSSLLKQSSFDKLYRASNIESIRGETFDTIICAGAPGQKWAANLNPVADLENIEKLISCLSKVNCKSFILISTVDVFKSPLDVDEFDKIDEVGLHAYGLHRRLLEKFVEHQFSNHLIVRLPGLVGPGLRKNIVFDFLNDNGLDTIDHRGVFQFYPMVNLWADIKIALAAGLNLVHLTSVPLSVGEVADSGFGFTFNRELSKDFAKYDMRTRYSTIFGGSGQYTYSRREVILAIRAYALSEAAYKGNVGVS
ncbi:pyridine nucleotide transhydrogenase [Pseudomonas gingeri]